MNDRIDGGRVYTAVKAGQWYSGDGRVLARELDSYIAAALVPDASAPVRAALAPHAGYRYSGGVAGHVYRALASDAASGRGAQAVVALGFSHAGGYGQGRCAVSILDADVFRTPLGDAPIDVDLSRRLAETSPLFALDNTAHMREHSAEMQIPFLQRALPGVPLTVLLMNGFEDAAVDCLAAALEREALARPIVAIGSTDLLHDPSLDRVVREDARTVAQMVDMDDGALAARWSRSHQPCCGIGPVRAVMRFARRMGIRRGESLAYMNSADRFPMQRNDYVVGYAAIVYRESGKVQA